MAKIASSLLLLLAIAASVSAKNWMAKCPKIKPMENIDINKVMGDWYMLSTNAEFPAKCGKINLKENSPTLIDYSFSLISQSEEEVKGQLALSTDPNQPGVFKFPADYLVKGPLGRSRVESIETHTVLIDTDYTNILAGYTCAEVNHFWMNEVKSDFFVVVRNRDFDSLKQATKAIIKLASLGFDMNTARFEYQGEKCTN